MSQSPPSAKRTRLAEADEGDPSTGMVSPSIANLKRHDEFWLYDGNIILVAGGTACRIYKGLLAGQSTVFSDMFAASTANADEVFDQCPVVELSDSPEDLAHLLRVLLPRHQRFFHRRDDDEQRSFDEVASVIRVAHKYHIQDVQDQAIASLQQSQFTHIFSEWENTDGSVDVDEIHAIGAVNLARLTDTPLMLPIALYRCCLLDGALLDGWKREDGTVEHLPIEDVKRCLEGRLTLAREKVAVLSRMLRKPADNCSASAECRATLQVILAWLLEKELEVVVNNNPLASLRYDVSWARGARKLCANCLAALDARDQDARRELWNKLPDIFGLAVDGWEE